MAIDTPHFALPFRFAGTSVAVVEQDSPDNIAMCVEAVCRYRQGDRPEEPNFGRPKDLEFAKGALDLEALSKQISESEPRATYLLTEHPDLFDSAVRQVGIAIRGDA